MNYIVLRFLNMKLFKSREGRNKNYKPKSEKENRQSTSQ
jgi:hypothetical protein